MSRNANRLTRKSKSDNSNDTYVAPNKKYATQAVEKLKIFTPTSSQKTLMNTIRENTLTFVDSPAGTGKSSTVLWHFVKDYLADHTKQIIVVRTPVEFADDKIGFLPSDLNSKTEVHFAAAKKILEDFLGKGKLESDLNERINFKIPNYMLGCTFTNSLVLIDEAQQLSPQILKLVLERIGEGCKVVVAGDSAQLFESGGKRNGLADAIDRFFNVDQQGCIIAKYTDIGFHEFGVSEIMRSDIVKTVVTAYGNMRGY
jgi:phosphate starvation-inducible PhoH-like protein